VETYLESTDFPAILFVPNPSREIHCYCISVPLYINEDVIPFMVYCRYHTMTYNTRCHQQFINL